MATTLVEPKIKVSEKNTVKIPVKSQEKFDWWDFL